MNNLSAQKQQEAIIIFTAHSIPYSMADGCRYVEQLEQAAQLVMKEAQLPNQWQMVYQSRSGSPSQPWLEPDINSCIKQLNSNKDVIIVPIGFVSDHMEILYDLDTETKQLCENLGISYTRAKTAGTHPKFVSMIKKLVNEKIALANVENAQNSILNNQFCFAACCPKG